MPKSVFVCQQCGATHRKWMGQCSACREWDCICEEAETGIAQQIKAKAITTVSIQKVKSHKQARSSTQIEELDRVLGGGLVPASAILIGGDPGIGKSTLLLQTSSLLAAQGSVLYISGEESVQQIHMRGQRLQAMHPKLELAACTDIEKIIATTQHIKPLALVIDSIQTMVSNQLSSAPGTVAQVRECAAKLIQHAKQQGHALILVGHVTKDGTIAGPRVLEHMVDAVLYFEGDRGHAHRILRAVKNRFGPAGEIGVFEMQDKGLVGVRDASKLFLAERAKDVPGSVVLACMEGTRPLLLEVQALIAPTVYATPKRSSVGLDVNRIAMLTAVLERRIGLPLNQHDVYVNLVGGTRIHEPAADLAILLAIVSAYQERVFPDDMVVFGEVGLTGEIRAVSQPEARMKECMHMGFSRLLIPESNKERLKESKATLGKSGENTLAFKPIRHLSDAIQAALNAT
ncbi:MAG: DNA repair protein RadA [Mariprofundaceae bacterium]|nr:DNA repair protein RadA [Mariprofundaceae bacterium]